MNTRYTIGIIIALLLLGGSWYLASNHPNNERQYPEEATQTTESVLTIATSFYPLQFAAERIVGDLGVVTNIGAGVDPHNYEPSARDMLTLERADLVVLQGVDFEPWGDGVARQLRTNGVAVHIATAGLNLMENEDHEEGDEHGEEVDHEEDEADHEEDEEEHEEEADHDEADEDGHDDHGEFDPHTWLDPVLFGKMVEGLTATVIATNPENSDIYRANATKLQAELANLNGRYENRLASCELDEVITSHDAFGYVAKRYHFSAHSIAGISTQDTPSVTTLATLREEAAEGIGAILLEENNITAYGETLARETGLQTLALNPIAYAIPDDEDYLTLMQKNLDAFAIALKCDE